MTTEIQPEQLEQPEFLCQGHRVNVALLTATVQYRAILKSVDKDRNFFRRLLLSEHCYTCGKNVVFTKKKNKYTAKTKCRYPNGYTIHFELNVPSGKIVVADDLRQYFNPNASTDVNGALGRKKTTLAFANIGCAHGFVGNSCPGIYQVKHNEYAIVGDPQHIKGKRVGGIVTDLWWYSIVDYDEYVLRAKRQPTEDVIQVKPGVYKFSHYYDNLKRINYADYETPDIVYANFKWIRKPDPVRDFNAEQKKITFTAEQIIYKSMSKYPTLYGLPKNSNVKGIQQKANDIFIAIGTGGLWHKNGHVQFDLDTPKNCPKIKIPIFKDIYDWSDINEYSSILAAAKHPKAYDPHIPLNPSFARLAINVVNCIVEYGYKGRPDTTENMKKRQIKLAKECRERLIKMYPKEAEQIMKKPKFSRKLKVDKKTQKPV